MVLFEMRSDEADEGLCRLSTIPGTGPVTPGAVAAFTPDLDRFESGRNVAAWPRPVPKRRPTGDKPEPGSFSQPRGLSFWSLLTTASVTETELLNFGQTNTEAAVSGIKVGQKVAASASICAFIQR